MNAILIPKTFEVVNFDSRAALRPLFFLQSWKDQLQKAKDLYEQAKSATRRQTLLARNSSRSYCSGELVMDVEYRHQQYVASRMVSRGSRMSSVTGGGGHSHSGSMDISGDSPQSGTPGGGATSNSIRRNRSFEYRQQQQLQQQQLQQQHEGHRASSFSSDDGNNGHPQQQQHPTNASTPSPLSPLKQQQSLPAQGSYPASPRVERRLTTGGVTPNTLTVQITGNASSAATAAAVAAESAAAAAASASIPTSSSFPCNSSSRSPADSPSWQSRSRSPGPRGITYPPPSPKSLKRGVAIQSSLSLKNPPLLKSRPVQQTIPVITGKSNNYGSGNPPTM